MRPMLATVGETVPPGPEWAHEVKWDGMRVLAEVRDHTLRLWSRVENDVTVSFPELAGLGAAYEDLLLDGEVVALDGGRPTFAALGERMHVKDPRKAERLVATRPVTFMVFDLLRLFGNDLTDQPWTARRELLERLDLDVPHVQVPEVYDDGTDLFEATKTGGLEGIVSKRRSSLYTAGRRSKDWRKLPHRATLSAVVGGWRPEVGSPGRLGAVLLGLPATGGGWRYAGRMGSGITGASARTLAAQLAPLRVDASPFVDEVPRIDAKGTTWVEPVVVVEFRTLSEASHSRMRQPAFLGIRDDLRPQDLLAEFADQAAREAGDG